MGVENVTRTMQPPTTDDTSSINPSNIDVVPPIPSRDKGEVTGVENNVAPVQSPMADGSSPIKPNNNDAVPRSFLGAIVVFQV